MPIHNQNRPAAARTQGNVPSSNAGAKAQREDAQAWVNIGYTDEVTGEFVALPVGIPLDQMKPLKRRQPTALDQARNDMLAEFIEMAMQQMQPGETRVLDMQVQIRRVSPQQAAPVQQRQGFSLSSRLVSSSSQSAAIRETQDEESEIQPDSDLPF